MAVEILTPCRDQSHEEEHCAVHCPELNEPVWNEFLGGWFHVDELLTPQERTARAHADLQAERLSQEIRDRINARVRDYESHYSSEFIDAFFRMSSEPSDPGTTMPPQLDP